MSATIQRLVHLQWPAGGSCMPEKQTTPSTEINSFLVMGIVDFASYEHSKGTIHSSLGDFGSLDLYRIQRNHAQPTINVISVIGIPTRKYSQEPIVASGLALSTTMMFAMLPVMVRFPAQVEAIAKASHAVCGSEKFGTSDFKSITAGTLLTILLSKATAVVNAASWCRFQCSAIPRNSPTMPAFSAPPTIRKGPTKNTRSPQSTAS